MQCDVKIRPKYLNFKGLSLIEIIISVAILVSSAVGITTIASSYAKFTKVSRNLDQLQSEHNAIKRLLAAIPGNKATFIICGRAHPFVDYLVLQDRCIVGTNADIDFTKEANWTALSTAYFQWANTPTTDGHHLSPVLSASDYSANVVPKLSAAGCLACHDGGAKSGGTPDFNSYAAMSAGPTPFVSYLGLGSALGRRLLKGQSTFQNILVGAANASAETGQVFHNLSLSLSSGDQCSPPIVRNQISANFTTEAAAKCPSPSDSPRCAACKASEYCNIATCIYYCSDFNTPTSSETPATCTTYTQTADCYLPNPGCPVPSNRCPAGTVQSNCQEFQNSLVCGFGATTWRCPNPANPVTPQANVVLYSLTSSYTQTETGNNRQVSSQGALP